MNHHNLSMLSPNSSTTQSIHSRVPLSRDKHIARLQELSNPPRLISILVLEDDLWTAYRKLPGAELPRGHFPVVSSEVCDAYEVLELVGLAVVAAATVHQMICWHSGVAAVPYLSPFDICAVLGEVVEDVCGLSHGRHQICGIDQLTAQGCWFVGQIAVVAGTAAADCIPVVFEDHIVVSSKWIMECAGSMVPPASKLHANGSLSG
jgi:hypothetical protein